MKGNVASLPPTPTAPADAKRANSRPSPVELPATRGERTRLALVAAARQIFERDGFLDARISDMTAAAGVAHGTFYTHFKTKEDIFREVTRSLISISVGAAAGATVHGGGPVAHIDRANRRYLETYRRNARMMAVIEQCETFNGELQSIRRERMMSFVQRIEASIVELQNQGLADADLDPHYAAVALTGMVGRFAHIVYVLDEPLEFDNVVWHATRLWANALKLSVDEPDLTQKPKPRATAPAKSPKRSMGGMNSPRIERGLRGR